MNYERLAEVMRDLALKGGRKIMEIYQADDFDVKVKSDESPVTEADEAADAIISAGLREAFPDVLLVTEEQAATHGEKAGTFLIVDPLDGTKEFIHRRGRFHGEHCLCNRRCAGARRGLCPGQEPDVPDTGRWQCGRGGRAVWAGDGHSQTRSGCHSRTTVR